MSHLVTNSPGNLCPASQGVSSENNEMSARTWSPWPVRTPFLACFAIFCIALCISIELILTRCSPTGCHVFGALSATTVPAISTFVYTLLPTILSVSFSFVWGVVHHDLLRFEPYFQMSEPEGALAEDSILLEYPYTFPPLVPLMAWRRRHYIVSLSSCILLATNLYVTPLTSGLFDSQLLVKSLTGEALRSRYHLPVGTSSGFSGVFSYVAYDHMWLGGPITPFTTPEFGLLPVQPTLGMSPENETWSAVTTLLEADLTCWSPIVTRIWHPELGNVGINITVSLDGTNYSEVLWDQGTFSLDQLEKAYSDFDRNLIPWPFYTPWTMIELRIGEWSSETTLYIWASSVHYGSDGKPGISTLPRNLTAIVCTPSYYSQSVQARFTMPSGNITGVSRLGAQIPLKVPCFAQIFMGGECGFIENPSQFLDNLGNLVGFGYKPPILPNLDSRLRRRFGTRPSNLEKYYELGHQSLDESYSSVYMPYVYSIFAFALYNHTSDTLVGLLDPQKLEKSIRTAVKLLFAIAVGTEMVDHDNPEIIPIMRDVQTRGFVVNYIWARSAQGGLAILAILGLAVVVLTYFRRCELDGEPNSLAAALQLLATSPEMCARMLDAEFTPQKEFRVMLTARGGRYRLRQKNLRGPMVQIVTENMEETRAERSNVNTTDARCTPNPTLKEPCATEQHWTFRTSAGMGLITFFGLMALVLLVVFVISRALNGLTTFGGTNSFAYKLLYSYFPIVYGLALEPILVSLGTYWCMLRPYQMLRRGSGRGKRALVIDYEKSLPQFQVLRSLRSGDVTLSALSIAILLAYVLPVALAGLFSPTTRLFNIRANVQTSDLPKVNETFKDRAQEMYYALSQNVTASHHILPWVTPELFVLPFFPLDANNEVYQGPTLAIGGNVECSRVSPDKVTFECPLIDERGSYNTSCASMQNSNRFSFSISIDDVCLNSTNYQDSFSWNGPSTDQLLQSSCPDVFFVLWTELPGDPQPRNLSSPYKDHLDAIVLKCTSSDNLYELTASINAAKQVISTTGTRPLGRQYTIAMYPGKNFSKLTQDFNNAMISGSQVGGSGDPQLGWINYFMSIFHPSIVRHLTNVTRLPHSEHLTSAFEDVYRRLFAIHLQIYADEILSTSQWHVESGMVAVMMERVNVSQTMFLIVMCILIYMVVVLVVLYRWQRPYLPGRMPTCLAGMYALLYASNAQTDFGLGDSPHERLKDLDGLYKLGWFEGADQNQHFGVYREFTASAGADVVN